MMHSLPSLGVCVIEIASYPDASVTIIATQVKTGEKFCMAFIKEEAEEMFQSYHNDFKLICNSLRIDRHEKLYLLPPRENENTS